MFITNSGIKVAFRHEPPSQAPSEKERIIYMDYSHKTKLTPYEIKTLMKRAGMWHEGSTECIIYDGEFKDRASSPIFTFATTNYNPQDRFRTVDSSTGEVAQPVNWSRRLGRIFAFRKAISKYQGPNRDEIVQAFNANNFITPEEEQAYGLV